MDTINLVFTKSLLSPVSWLIRWVLPRSRFSLAMSSHCLIQFGDSYYQADLFNGVNLIVGGTALSGCTVVKKIAYSVKDAQAGRNFLDNQLGKKYDLTGVLGISLAPDRDWSEDDSLFCYELGAGALKAAGRDDFQNLNHITEIALMAVKP